MVQAAKVLTNYIISKGKIKEQERDLYEYGLTLILEKSLCIVICVCISLLLRMFIEGIFFFGIFIPLRSYMGGLHMKNYGSCLVLSCLFFSIVLLVAKFVQLPTCIALILQALCEICLFVMKPIENENRPVDEEENQYFYSMLYKILILDFIVSCLLAVFGLSRYTLVIFLTFVMNVLTVLLSKIMVYRH